MRRIKLSSIHYVSHRDGYAWTKYLGGRAKLAGLKKGSRDWRQYFVCLCPNGKHCPLPAEVEYSSFDMHGNPPEDLSWEYGCPVNALSLMLRLQFRLPDQKLFRKWSHAKYYKGNRMLAQNYGDPVPVATIIITMIMVWYVQNPK